MKKNLLLLITSTLAIAVGTPETKAARLNFEELEGVFKNGTTTLVYSGSTYTGSSRVTVKPTNKGRKGRLTVAGNFVVGGTNYDAANTYQFGGGSSFSTQRLAPVILDTPLSGTFTSNAKKLQAIGTAIYMGSATVRVTVKLKKPKRKRR